VNESAHSFIDSGSNAQADALSRCPSAIALDTLRSHDAPALTVASLDSKDTRSINSSVTLGMPSTNRQIVPRCLLRSPTLRRHLLRESCDSSLPRSSSSRLPNPHPHHTSMVAVGKHMDCPFCKRAPCAYRIRIRLWRSILRPTSSTT
jgi:hypothetical protein